MPNNPLSNLTRDQYADFGKMFCDMLGAHFDVSDFFERPMKDMPSDKMADAYVAVWARLNADLSTARTQLAEARQALTGIAAKGCGVIHMDSEYGKNATCIDEMNHAIQHPERYTGNDYYHKKKAGEHLCTACIAAHVLSLLSPAAADA